MSNRGVFTLTNPRRVIFTFNTAIKKKDKDYATVQKK